MSNEKTISTPWIKDVKNKKPKRYNLKCLSKDHKKETTNENKSIISNFSKKI